MVENSFNIITNLFQDGNVINVVQISVVQL